MRGCSVVLASDRLARPGIGEAPRAGLSQIAPLVDELLERARRAGTIRRDVVFSDLAVALMSVRAVADLFDRQVPPCSARYLELVMDGFRPGGRPWTHEPMSTPQLAAVLVGP